MQSNPIPTTGENPSAPVLLLVSCLFLPPPLPTLLFPHHIILTDWHFVIFIASPPFVILLNNLKNWFEKHIIWNQCWLLLIIMTYLVDSMCFCVYLFIYLLYCKCIIITTSLESMLNSYWQKHSYWHCSLIHIAVSLTVSSLVLIQLAHCYSITPLPPASCITDCTFTSLV